MAKVDKSCPHCLTSCDLRVSYSNLELYKEFAEQAYSIALHPTGLYILVGFSDKLRLMNLLIDDIRTFKEFTIKGCREVSTVLIEGSDAIVKQRITVAAVSQLCIRSYVVRSLNINVPSSHLQCSFSNGGHYFAAVHGNIIQIYSTTTFENISNLKGHNGKVKSVIWSADDSKIVSCGMDGAVYEWDSFNGKRVGEYVLKSCSYTSVTIAPDGKTTFAVGSDKTLKEIADSQKLRDVDSGDTTLTSVAMSHSGRMLFSGTNSGTLRSFKFPLTQPGEWTEYQGHSAAIIKMKITYDDQFLITVSEDACVLIWKIQDKEGRGMKRDKEVGYAEEILITKSDLEEKVSASSSSSCLTFY